MVTWGVLASHRESGYAFRGVAGEERVEPSAMVQSLARVGRGAGC